MAVLGVTKSSKFGVESSITVTKTSSSFFFGARQLPLNDTATRQNRLDNRQLVLKKAKICRKGDKNGHCYVSPRGGVIAQLPVLPARPFVTS